MSINIKIIGPTQSKDRALGIIASIFDQYEWQSDEDTHGRIEWWMGYLEQLKTENVIRDDCDSFSRLIIDLLFFLGGFNMSSLAECVVDVNAEDENIFDHHVGAVLVNGDWLYFHCWSDKLLTCSEIEGGCYLLPNGQRAAPLKIIQHRKITGGYSDWIVGEVK